MCKRNERLVKEGRREETKVERVKKRQNIAFKWL